MLCIYFLGFLLIMVASYVAKFDFSNVLYNGNKANSYDVATTTCIHIKAGII